MATPYLEELHQDDDPQDGLPTRVCLDRMLCEISDGTFATTAMLMGIAAQSPQHLSRVMESVITFATENASENEGALSFPFLTFLATTTLLFKADPTPEVMARLPQFASTLLKNVDLLIAGDLNRSPIIWNDTADADAVADYDPANEAAAELEAPEHMVACGVLDQVLLLIPRLPELTSEIQLAASSTIVSGCSAVESDPSNFLDEDSIWLLHSITRLATDVNPPEVFDTLVDLADRVGTYIGLEFTFSNPEHAPEFDPLDDPPQDELEGLFGTLLIAIGRMQYDRRLVDSWHALIEDCPLDADWIGSAFIGLAHADTEELERYLPVLVNSVAGGDLEQAQMLARLLELRGVASALLQLEPRPPHLQDAIGVLRRRVEAEDISISTSGLQNLNDLLPAVGLPRFGEGLDGQNTSA